MVELGLSKSEKLLNVGIVGAGDAGNMHAMAWQSNSNVARLAAVCEKNKSVAETFAKAYGIETYYTNLEEFLSNEDIDAVSVCVPHHLHGDIAVEVLKAGKHLLLEKPIANTLGEADRIISAAKKAKVKFMVAEQHLFLPVHRLIKQLIEEGRLGRIFLATSYEGGSGVESMSDPESWKCTWEKGGGGALMDTGVHRLHLYRWLLGDVERVYCWIAKQVVKDVKGKAEDNAIMMLRFKDGVLAQLTMSFTVASDSWNDRLELYGTEGTILEDHMWQEPLLMFSTTPGPGQCEWYKPKVEHEPYPGTYRISFMNEVKHFADCIMNDKEPESSGEDARAAVEMALLGYLSAKTHKETKPGDVTPSYRPRE